MATIENFLEGLQLTPAGDDRYTASNITGFGHEVVFGGQLLAQSIVAALAGQEGKTVKTLHTVFARGARPDQGVELTVDRMSSGRTFGSATVTISQGDRLCARSLVLLTSDEPDFIRHGDQPLKLSSAEDAVPGPESGGAWEVRIVDGVDIMDPSLVGPPDLDVWTRFAGAPSDAAVSQALLSFATDGFLIATAMRPHEGVGQAQAHRSVDTGVISHTLTFHEPVAAGEWHLLSHHVPYSGRGRSFGTANIFDASGAIVASYVQDSMIRKMPERA